MNDEILKKIEDMEKKLDNLLGQVKIVIDSLIDEGILLDPNDPITEYDEVDELFENALLLIMESGEPSIFLIQANLDIGYARSARIMDQLKEYKFVLETDNEFQPLKINFNKFSKKYLH